MLAALSPRLRRAPRPRHTCGRPDLHLEPAMTAFALRLALASLVLALLAGLTTVATQAADLSGPWVGSWQSDGTGHRGPLRATFTRINNTQYQVTFRGRFFKVIPFRYSLVLNVIEE